MQLSIDVLADSEHPSVKSAGHHLTDQQWSVAERVERTFYIVRDEIKFYFPDEGDFVKALKRSNRNVVSATRKRH